MIDFIKTHFGGKRSDVVVDDDFSDFFYNAKAREKVKVMRDVMRDATKKQQAVSRKARCS